MDRWQIWTKTQGLRKFYYVVDTKRADPWANAENMGDHKARGFERAQNLINLRNRAEESRKL